MAPENNTQRFILVLVFIFVSLSFSLADASSFRVVWVHDGDTITVEPAKGGARVRIRLYGIDCPETNQPYGLVAKNYVKNTLLYKPVNIKVKDKDRYGRTVAIVTLETGKILQEELLQAGLAWVEPRHCKKCNDWRALQKEAGKNRQGLWRDKNPVPPWKWRQDFPLSPS